jgi:hypothetical protein
VNEHSGDERPIECIEGRWTAGIHVSLTFQVICKSVEPVEPGKITFNEAWAAM